MEKRKVLDIKDFVYLLLATLAKNTKIIDSRDKNKKIISLPIQYKQIIENILCADNCWNEKFSILIDIEEYFRDHFVWEIKLAAALKEALIGLDKTFEYGFEVDQLFICFTQDEINTILSRYQDEELKKVMNHFANLLVDFIYTREYQETYHDYYASAVRKMHNIKVSQLNNAVNDTGKKNKTRVKSLFKKNKKLQDNRETK